MTAVLFSKYMSISSISTKITASYAYFVSITWHMITYHSQKHIFPDLFHFPHLFPDDLQIPALFSTFSRRVATLYINKVSHHKQINGNDFYKTNQNLVTAVWTNYTSRWNTPTTATECPKVITFHQQIAPDIFNSSSSGRRPPPM